MVYAANCYFQFSSYYHTTPLRPGTRDAATARGALGWYRPSVGVPRDVGCCALVVFAAYIFSVQFMWRELSALALAPVGGKPELAQLAQERVSYCICMNLVLHVRVNTTHS